MSKWISQPTPAPAVEELENEAVPTFAEQHAAIMELRQSVENHTRVASEAWRAVRPAHNETLTDCRIENGNVMLQFRISYGIDRGTRTVVLMDNGDEYALLLNNRQVTQARLVAVTEAVPARPRGSARTGTTAPRVPDVMSRPRPTVCRLVDVTDPDQPETICENVTDPTWATKLAIGLAEKYDLLVEVVTTQDGKLVGTPARYAYDGQVL